LIVQATRYFSWTDDRQRIFSTREKRAKKKLSLLPSRKFFPAIMQRSELITDAGY
jgi:hypothetical protein